MREIFNDLAESIGHTVKNYRSTAKPTTVENNILNSLKPTHENLIALLKKGDNELTESKLEDFLSDIEIIVDLNKVSVWHLVAPTEYFQTPLAEKKITPLVERIRTRAKEFLQKKSEPEPISDQQQLQQSDDLITVKVQAAIQPLQTEINTQKTELDNLRKTTEKLQQESTTLREENTSLIAKNSQLTAENNKLALQSFRFSDFLKKGTIFIHIPDGSSADEIAKELNIDRKLIKGPEPQANSNNNSAKLRLPSEGPYVYKQPEEGFKAAQANKTLDAWLDQVPEENYIHYEKYKLDHALPQTLYGMIAKLATAMKVGYTQNINTSNSVYSGTQLTSADKVIAKKFIYNIINISLLENAEYEKIPWQAKIDSIFTEEAMQTVSNPIFSALIEELKKFDIYSDEMPPKVSLTDRKALLCSLCYEDTRENAKAKYKYKFIPGDNDFSSRLNEQVQAAVKQNRK